MEIIGHYIHNPHRRHLPFICFEKKKKSLADIHFFLYFNYPNKLVFRNPRLFFTLKQLKGGVFIPKVHVVHALIVCGSHHKQVERLIYGFPFSVTNAHQM